MSISTSFDLGFQPDDEVASKIQSYALNFLRDVTPVRTGRLINGWNVAVVGSQVLVTNDVEYAGFVDGGTSRMAARDMTSQTEPAVIDFAAEMNEAANFAARVKGMELLRTGDAEVDALIDAAAANALGGVLPANIAPQKLGLLTTGLRTLLAYDESAEVLRNDPVLSALDDLSGGVLGINPTRYRTLLDEYGQVGARTAVTPNVTNF